MSCHITFQQYLNTLHKLSPDIIKSALFLQQSSSNSKVFIQFIFSSLVSCQRYCLNFVEALTYSCRNCSGTKVKSPKKVQPYRVYDIWKINRDYRHFPVLSYCDLSVEVGLLANVVFLLQGKSHTFLQFSNVYELHLVTSVNQINYKIYGQYLKLTMGSFCKPQTNRHEVLFSAGVQVSLINGIFICKLSLKCLKLTSPAALDDLCKPGFLPWCRKIGILRVSISQALFDCLKFSAPGAPQFSNPSSI